VKKWIVIIGVILSCLIVVVAGGGYIWFHHTLKKSLPRISGVVNLQGLKEDVEIIRDTYGVPHIYARNEHDLFFALGYVLSQDRFWQMEFHRRLGQGRLSEILGEDFVEVDRYFRMLTAAGLNKEIPGELRSNLQSFADGVNAYLESYTDLLPFEFTVLGYRPDPWNAEDYLAILKVVNWGLSSGWHADLTAAEILEKVGEEKLREAFPVWPDDAPLIIPEETKTLEKVSELTSKTIRVREKLAIFSCPAASNNWVISGKKSVTGKPILANDPHLGLTNPSVWWEVHLVCPTMNVSGFVVLGVPGVAVGHNEYVAWGVTNVMVDDVDFFIEKINPKNPRQYWYKDHWEDMRVIEETIRVKGKDPVKAEILLTRHGPIINEVKQGSEDDVISARWAFTECLQPVQASTLLAKAENIDGVIEALRYWELPSQNFVFADTSGNIGYWCCATVPIRSKGDGLLPVPGWTGEYEWQGYVSFGDRPHVINPEDGLIATANNKVTGTHYPFLISHYWEPMDRITRILQLLNSKETLSIEDFKRMHMDVYCVLASEMTPIMIEVLDKRFSDQEAQKVKDILSGWDFMMAKDSVGACLFEVTYLNMMENIFKDELGEALYQKYIQVSSFPARAMRMMLRKGTSLWFDDLNTSQKETIEDIIAKSLGQMLSELKERIGSDIHTWTWGKIHSLTFEHVLGKKKPLDRIFNLGPFPVGGSHLTIDMKHYSSDKPYKVNHGVSERMIVDFSNMNGSLHVLPTGESGHLRSPHHRDQIELYLSGKYHPAWMDREDIETHSEGTLVLKPKP
jgi:penicillin amidase